MCHLPERSIRALFLLFILVAVAGCDSSESNPLAARLEGSWVTSDPVVTTGRTEGRLDQRYTFRVEDERITGDRVIESFSQAGDLIHRSETAIRGTLVGSQLSITLVPQGVTTVHEGVVPEPGASLRLYDEDDEVRVRPFVELQRSP